MKQSYVIPLTLLLAIAASCKEEEEEPGDSNYKLSAEDLAAPASIEPLASVEISDAMENSRSDFLANDSSVSDTNTSDCLLSTFYSLPVSAEGDTITLDVALNISSCLEETYSEVFPGATLNLKKAIFSFYLTNTCEGQDLGSLNGKKISELDAFACDGGERNLVNLKSEFDLTLTIEGRGLAMSNVSVSATSTLANEPCTAAVSGEERTSSNDCVDISKSVTKSDVAESSYYSKFAHKDLKWTDSDTNTWFSSGSMDLTFNDWTGSITFNGALEPPTYSLTNGTESVTGELSLPVSGLSLADGAYRSASRAIKDAVERSKALAVNTGLIKR